MKEYDIFLKQRLTEGSIIVYSLPFRDISCKQSSFAGDAVIFQPAKENCSGKSICSVVGDRRDAGYGQ